MTAVHESKRVIDQVYEISGTDGLHGGHVLSRLMRDSLAMPMHTVARKARFETIARVAEGDERLLPFI